MLRDKRKQNRTVPSDASVSAGQQTRHRLLLIEDHDGLAEATAEFLRGEGLEVRVVLCGRDALEIAPAFQPEIVLCDMSLPDITGLEVVVALRSSLSTKSPLIAIYTAMTDADIRLFRRSVPTPAVDLFLSKPLDSQKLQILLSALNTLRPAVAKKTR